MRWLILLAVILGTAQLGAIDFVRDENGYPILPDWCFNTFAAKAREEKSAITQTPVPENQKALLEKIEKELMHDRSWTTPEKEVYELLAKFLTETRHEKTAKIVLEESWKDIDVYELLQGVFSDLGGTEQHIDYTDPVGSLVSFIQDTKVVIFVELNDEYAPEQLYPVADAIKQLRADTPHTYFVFYSPMDNGTVTSSDAY